MSDDKFKRVRYIRALEKFAKSAINNLKRDDFDLEIFNQRISKNKQSLEKVEPVYLDSPYTRGLLDFVNLVLSSENRENLIKSANHLDKLKNSKTYKKSKHKGENYDNYF